MIKFSEETQISIYYSLGVLAVVATLILLTNVIHNWLGKRAKQRHPGEEPNTINLVRRIFKTLWIILGLSAISFVFIDKKYYDQAQENFWMILYLGVVIVATIVSVSMVQTLFSRAINKRISEQGDPTSFKFLRNLAVIGVYFIGSMLAIMAFPSLRGLAQTALGGAGVLAVVAGVASQEALANLVGGVFIITFKPFKINDIIKISDDMVGTVTDITLRHTIIKNYENKMIVIPNSIINKEKLINYDLGDHKCCQWIEIGISYDSDIDLAKEIMTKECMAHPNLIDNRTSEQIKNGDPKVLVRVIKLNDSAVTLRAWAWAWDFPSAFTMKCDLFESIKKRFDAEGIEIPFPHRTMVFKEKQLKTLKEELKTDFPQKNQ